MEEARAAIRKHFTVLKTFLAQESVPRLSEADTKAHFIEPVIASLGWVGIGVVTREYYVRNSHEFLDYALFARLGGGSSDVPTVAIETKALQVELTEKHAAQLIQYCAVEGIEWAALTNARELQFFNTFLKPDLGAKRVMRLDLVAFNSDDDFDVLFEQLWQLSRDSITSASVRTWLKQVRLDKIIRQALLDPSSPTVKHVLNVLADSDLHSSPHELVQWFRAHLVPNVPRISTARTSAPDVSLRFDVGTVEELKSGPSIAKVSEDTSSRPSIPATSQQRTAYYGITIWDLVRTGLLPVGTPLILTSRGEVLTRAEVGPNGEIIWRGEFYRSLSARAFCSVFNPPAQSFNGWIHWYAEFPQGRVLMSELRDRFKSSGFQGGNRSDDLRQDAG